MQSLHGLPGGFQVRGMLPDLVHKGVSVGSAPAHGGQPLHLLLEDRSRPSASAGAQEPAVEATSGSPRRVPALPCRGITMDGGRTHARGCAALVLVTAVSAGLKQFGSGRRGCHRRDTPDSQRDPASDWSYTSAS